LSFPLDFATDQPGRIGLALAIGYGIGSIPFGLLLTRFAGTQDIRTIGSGNIGATNVLRTGRKDLAAATLLLDALKGTLAVAIGQALGGPWLGLWAALGAFTGHLFPIWLSFRGGKGVATFLGCIIGTNLLAALIFAVTWLLMAYLFRYSSLAALTASLAATAVLWLTAPMQVAVTFSVLTAALWFMHRANIGRLIAGGEGKIGQ
jgi:acyl phosphate:glycerol-3-phosphate acyltransferase